MPVPQPEQADKFTWTSFTVVKPKPPKKHLSYRDRLQTLSESSTPPLSTYDLYSPDQPRDEGGRFSDAGAPYFARNPRLAAFRSIPVVRSEGTGSRHPEAEVAGGKIHLYPKFDLLSPKTQDFVFAHEVGHAVLDQHGLAKLVADAEKMGVDVWNTATLPFGQSNMHEAFADAFASYHTDKDVVGRYPAWAALVERAAAQHHNLRHDLGGEGSGNFGHAGRPGEVGGSAVAEAEDYRGQHGAPGRGAGAPLNDLTGAGTVYPDDIYSSQAVQYYGTGDRVRDRETMAIIKRMKDRPDVSVPVYRAVPKAAPAVINPGDWVTINQHYAIEHGEGPLGGDYKIVTIAAKASDLFTNGDSIHEWGWDPEKKLSYRYSVATFLLGGEGSGNYGHAGRPGEVGGSAKTEGTQGLKFRDMTEDERDEFAVMSQAAKVGEKKDGGKVIVNTKVKGAQSQVAVEHAVFGKRDPADVVGQMVEDLPGNLRASWQFVDTQGDRSIPPGGTALRMYVRGERINFTRTFIREADGTLTVHHDVFELPKALQGKGVAKAVLADSYQTYRELGVDKIVTLANLDRGAYAWAKFGFKADRPATLATMLTENLKGRPATDRRVAKDSTLPDLTPSQRANMLAVIAQHKDDPKLPWHVANMVTAEGRQVGKELLYDSSWFAKLDMHDRESTAKLEAYVKGH